jgi:prolyl-tRNA synthetase
MRLSKMGFEANKIANLDAMFPAQDLLLKTGQLVQYASGIYGYGNVPYRVMGNIEKVIKDTLDEFGCVQVSLPILQPESIWQESGRWEKYINDGTMLLVHGKDQPANMSLAPTAEEAVMNFAKQKSYKSLPVIYYQIGAAKFRNELRNRGYLLRGKEFNMMDAYSFDFHERGLGESYGLMKNAYLEIFKKLDIEVIPVAADSGAIGGDNCEEFMTISEMGEDTIYIDRETKKGYNLEVLEKYKVDKKKCVERKSVELGHIFQIGNKKYSGIKCANYVGMDGKQLPYYMGCYGIGVSRILAIVYEKSIVRDDHGNPTGISLPENLAPYKYQIIYTEKKKESAEKFYTEQRANGVQCMLDDRDNVTFGAKIQDAKKLGTPYIVIFGDKTPDGKYEIENTKTGEKKVL